MPLFSRRTPGPLPQGPLSFDGPPQVETRACDCCDDLNIQSIGVVDRGNSVFAAYWLVWYPASNEAWLDAALGSWREPDYADHVTFGCRIGAVEGQQAPACSLVPAARIRDDSPVLGTKLSPRAARKHPWVSDFWALTDWIILNDPVAREHLYDFDPNFTPR